LASEAHPGGPPRRWARIGALLALVWLGVLAAGYVAVHNPITARVALAAGGTLLAILAVAVMVGASGAIGRLIMRRLDGYSAPESAALQALAGLAVISILVMAAGLLHLVPPRWLAWALTVALAAALHRPLIAWARELADGLKAACAPLDDRAARWLRWGALALLALAVVLALAPPTKWDALTYHLAGPELYIEQGGMVSVPENHFLGFPMLVQMLYLWLMVLAGDTAPALLHAAFGGAMLLTLIGFAGRAGRPSAGWLAAAALLASESIWGEFSWPYNDLALMAYALAAVILLLDLPPGGERMRRVVWAGVMTGCMLGVKYTAAPYTVGVGLLALWSARRRGLAAMLREAALVTVVAAAVFAPWLAKNWIVDSNPVSPFVWGTRGLDELDQWHYLRPDTGLGLGQVIVLPVQVPIFGQEGGVFQGDTGPLVFALLPLVGVGWRRRDAAGRAMISGLAVYALPGVLSWLAGAATSWFLLQTRLLYPVFPALALIGGLGVEGLTGDPSLKDLGRIVRGIALAAVAVACLASAQVFLRASPLRVMTGLQPRDDYLLDQLQAHYAAMQAVNQLDEDAKVLFLWEPRTYYCERECIPDSIINQWWHDRQVYGDPSAIAGAWQTAGYTHVLVFEAGGRFLIEEERYDPMDERDWQALGELRGTALLKVWDELDSYTLYELAGQGSK
jgi:hypothetical protein